MAGNFYPYFKFGCSLDFDINRLKAYLTPTAEQCEAGETVCPINPPWGVAQIGCDCPTLDYSYDCCNLDAVAIPSEPYRTPALDLAPWYDPDIPESAFFMGMMIESVEGLEMSPTVRNVQRRTTGGGGGALGPLRRTERRMKFTVLMFACDECSMEYGMRWLIWQLASGGCSDCELCDAEVLTCCNGLTGIDPVTNRDLDTGRWQLKDVGLTDGPKIVDGPIEGMSCYVRRVEFELTSEQAWMYKCPTVCIENEPFPIGDPCDIEAWFCGPDPKICCRIEETKDIGETAITVVIDAREELRNVVITVTPDQFGYVCDPDSIPPGLVFVPPPCQTIVIPLMPEGYRFELNSEEEKITMTKPGHIVEDGTAYIQTEPGEAPQFITVSCGAYCVCVSAELCAPDGSTSTVSIYGTHREL